MRGSRQQACDQRSDDGGEANSRCSKACRDHGQQAYREKEFGAFGARGLGEQARQDQPAAQIHHDDGRAAAQRDPDTEVQLRADKKVPYGRVAEVIGIAQKAGLTRIGFVAEATPP